MDKWVINNFIVCMRSSVTQARVHIFNKLVREIRKLKNSKGAEQQREKKNRKAERLRREVLLIKKLRTDEISKYALLCQDNPAEKQKEASLHLEEHAKLRFAAHKNVAKQVEEFRTKYPDWALKLPPLLVQLGLKHKYKNDDSKKATKIVDPKKNPGKSSTDRESSLEDSSCESDSEAGSEQDMNNFGEAEEAAESQVQKDVKERGIITVDKIDLHKTSHQNSKSKTRIAEVRKFTDLLEAENIAKIQDSENSDESSIEVNDSQTSTTGVSDSFFLTGNESDSRVNDLNQKQNKEYSEKSSFRNQNHKAVKRNYFEGSKQFGGRFGKTCMQNTEKIPSLNRRQRRLMDRSKKDGRGVPSLNSGVISKVPKTLEKNKHLLAKTLSGFQKEEIGNLHPSWEAKRKQKEILPFQGKKIKFDED